MFGRLATVFCRNFAGRKFSTLPPIHKGSFPKLELLRQKNGFISIYRQFHVSEPRKVINPLLWMILKPISRVGAMIFGRTFRKWWFNLPPDRQRYLYEKFMKNRSKLLVGCACFCGFGSVYYYYHVEKTPITNRRRFITLTAKQFDAVCEFEGNLALKNFESMLLPDSDRRVKRIKKIAKQLLVANNDVPQIRDRKWAVHVVDSPTDNCFVVPNGHIFIFTGILKNFTENDDQLGIVLGHEMAHAVLGHGLENITRGQMLDFVKVFFGAIIWAIIPFNVSALFADIFASKALDVGLQLPYSRMLELEADDVGLQFAAKACFDPRECYAMWVGLQMRQKASGESQLEVPTFLSTHPSHGDRAKRIDPLVDEAIKIRGLCTCPPLKPYDPRLLADFKKQMMEQELALLGVV